MGIKSSPQSETCPVARALDIVGDRWSFLIIRDAFDGTQRFSEFQRNLRLSKSVLAIRLQSLVATGILEIIPDLDGSAYSRYTLTEKGRGLFLTIVSLRQWGEDYLFRPNEEHSVMLEQVSRKPVRKLQLRSHSGKALDARGVFVEKVRSEKAL
jgi:DNA-binding HxlR family transcriptional regulator